MQMEERSKNMLLYEEDYESSSSESDGKSDQDFLNSEDFQARRVKKLLPTSHPKDSNVRPVGKDTNNYCCSHCSRAFARRANCVRHEKICQENKKQIEPVYILCESCGSSFSRKDSRDKHQIKCSPAADSQARTRVVCNMENCKQKFFHRSALMNHFRLSHPSVTLTDTRILHFTSWDKFMVWKDNEEERSFSYFSQKCGKQNNRFYFYCQHDGSSKDHCPRQTSRKIRKGRIKTGKYCIAKMRVIVSNDGTVKVMYDPAHSHPCHPKDFYHHPLTSTTYKQIDESLARKVPPKQIFEDIFSKYVPEDFENLKVQDIKFRNQTVKKGRVMDIARSRRNSLRLHKNDAKSIDLLYHDLLQDDQDPVLLYKPHRGKVVKGPSEIDDIPGSDELFLFGIQTKRQRALMIKHIHKVLIVDETHGTNQHRYRLLTTMVTDEHNDGWPVAHLITSKSDEQALQFFWKALVERCPDLNVNCLITDDDPTLSRSAVSGLNVPVWHILCKWHFMKDIRNHVHFKAPRDMFDEVYEAIRLIAEASSEEEFRLHETCFKKKYGANPEMKKFISYFEKCLGRAEKWATCFRLQPHGNVNSINHVESFHNSLKIYYLKRKQNKRVDDLINILLKIEWDHHCKRYKLADANGIEQPSGDPKERHRKGMLFSDDQVFQLDCDTWEISSARKETVKYCVSRFTDKCSFDLCLFKCAELSCFQLCSHMYTCSCEDLDPICKHIHKINSVVMRNFVVQREDITKASYQEEDGAIMFVEQPEENNTCVDSPTQLEEEQLEFASAARLNNIHQCLASLAELFPLSSDVPNHLACYAEAALDEIFNRCKALSTAQVANTVTAEKNGPMQKLQIQEAADTLLFVLEDVEEVKNSGDSDYHSAPMVEGAVGEAALLHSSTAVSVSIPTNVIYDSKNCFTLSFSYVPNLRNQVLKCGMESISLLNVKSLECSLSPQELALCKSADSSFQLGCLYSSIVNAYLHMLSTKHITVLAVPSDVSLSVSRGFSANRLFTEEAMSGKNLLLFPTNLTNNHWTLVAVLIDECVIEYFDPLQQAQSSLQNNFLIQLLALVSKILPHVSSWQLRIMNHLGQCDTMNCGPLICWFAYEAACKVKHKALMKVLLFRKQIFRTVFANCCKRPVYDDESCGVCHSKYIDANASNSFEVWTSCMKCEQWYHMNCITFDSSVDFICP